jgi:hypothetical protein
MKFAFRLVCLVVTLLNVASSSQAQVSVYLSASPETFRYQESIQLYVSTWWQYHGWVCPYPSMCEPWYMSYQISGTDGFYRTGGDYLYGATGTSLFFIDSDNYASMNQVQYNVNITVTWRDIEMWNFYSDSASELAIVNPAPAPEIPIGEDSAFIRWADNEGYPTMGVFHGFLWGTQNGVFDGRRVRETDPYGGGTDGCWRQGDDPSWQFLHNSGATFGSADYWGEWREDVIGYYNLQVINYYRLNQRTPCQVEVPQVMEIECNDPRCSGPWVPYRYQWIRFGVTNDSVWVQRDNASASRAWY